MDANERRERASGEAALWWQQLQSGEMSRAEREQFVDWLRESVVHVAEMLRIAQVHNALAQFERWTEISTEGWEDEAVVEFPGGARGDSGSARGRASRSSRWGRMFAVTASLSAVAIAAGWLWLSWSGGQVIETVRGERREVALSDGSVLQVDPETKLTVRLGEERRQIVLEYGRALFRVAKDPGRPFLVRADGTTVRAVGTAFGVERRGQGITVTVAEGKVAVVSGEIGKAEPVAGEREASRAESRARKGSEESEGETRISREGEELSAVSIQRGPASGGNGLFLVAGQQVTVASGSAAAVRQVDSAKELAWADGRLIFEDDTVANVIREFNRYNLVQLHVADDQLAARPVSGVFDASDPESFVAFIQTVANVKVVRGKGQDITIASQ